MQGLLPKSPESVRAYTDVIEDNKPETATRGIYYIKSSCLGKRKHPCDSWRGWRLFDWAEETPEE